MARPVKNNLDYFSHDKDMRNDIKIRNLRRKFSHKGYSVYVMMLEHLSDCEYLQYEWNELSIELLVPDFDVDYEELVEIINHCIKLNLFEIQFGYLISTKLLERHLSFMGERKSFQFNNSPIMKLKEDLLNKSEINSVMESVNTQSKVKENKVKESKIKESKINESKINESKEKDICNKLIEAMKQVIDDGYITEEEVNNWKIADTREKLNYIFLDYPNWETDFWNLGLDAFIRKASFKSNIEINYIVHSTLKAHLLL